MFKRNQKIEVVPESAYTDFSHRDPSDAYATRKDLAIAALAPVALGAPFVAYRLINTPDTYTAATIPVTAPIVEPVNVIAQTTPPPTTLPIELSSVATPEMIPTGFIADSSLTMIANILDPLVQIMVAFSFPIASVIMTGACFFFMFNNSEKAWDVIMKAGLGYVLFQLMPMFLEILRQVGEAV
ncbi:hypothetical protein [Psychrobacillus sp. FSL K6-1415]|uniref:hypothetical protein n=1 Tax=Psychrobacillus sp. FSL K6-1415 TaxID=2921544 RepID=UPI0030FC3021